MIITHNGEAKVVLQDIQTYEKIQEGIAMLKLLAQSSASVKKRNYKSVSKAFNDIDERISEFKKNEI